MELGIGRLRKSVYRKKEFMSCKVIKSPKEKSKSKRAGEIHGRRTPVHAEIDKLFYGIRKKITKHNLIDCSGQQNLSQLQTKVSTFGLESCAKKPFLLRECEGPFKLKATENGGASPRLDLGWRNRAWGRKWSKKGCCWFSPVGYS